MPICKSNTRIERRRLEKEGAVSIENLNRGQLRDKLYAKPKGGVPAATLGGACGSTKPASAGAASCKQK
jgi:hypothetical protein